jgi:hypothetical protein
MGLKIVSKFTCESFDVNVVFGLLIEFGPNHHFHLECHDYLRTCQIPCAFLQLQVDEERFHPDKSCFIVLNQRNEVFFILSKIKIDVLNMNFFIKRIFAIFMLSVQVRMIVVL